jgi:hypothetical protein
MQQDYYSVLSSVIMASARDDSQLRGRIYELARSKLRRRLDWEADEFGSTARAQQLLALEIAIEQIEADLAGNSSRRIYSRANIRASVESSIEIMPPARRQPPLLEIPYESVPERATRPTSSTIRSLLPVFGAAILGVVATYVAVERGVYEDPHTKVRTDQNIPRNSEPSHFANMPTPSAYGVYILTNEKLTELEPLPIKVPDRGVANSRTFSTASTTKLPNGRTQFIAFGSDFVNNAPEKVVVRVVAQVMRASMSSRKEEVTTGDSGDLWTIRSTSYEMKVAPVDGNPAMIVIRPADAGFSFPAGRYALMLKGAAYDFSVDGPITDLARCVERTDELNGPVYAQCRNP